MWYSTTSTFVLRYIQYGTSCVPLCFLCISVAQPMNRFPNKENQVRTTVTLYTTTVRYPTMENLHPHQRIKTVERTQTVMYLGFYLSESDSISMSACLRGLSARALRKAAHSIFRFVSQHVSPVRWDVVFGSYAHAQNIVLGAIRHSPKLRPAHIRRRLPSDSMLSLKLRVFIFRHV